jgi:hypothetical protein
VNCSTVRRGTYERAASYSDHRMGRVDSRWMTGIGLAALCGMSSCTDGTATALNEVPAGRGGAGGRAGAAARVGGAGSSGGRAGNFGPRGEPPMDDPFCGDSPGDEPPSHADEDALLDAMNDAIARGEVCLTQALKPVSYLSDLSRRLTCPRAPRMPGWTFLDGLAEGWTWSGQAASLAEAKASLFATVPAEPGNMEPGRSVCDAARRTSYRQAGVGQRGNTWVFLMTE